MDQDSISISKVEAYNKLHLMVGLVWKRPTINSIWWLDYYGSGLQWNQFDVWISMVEAYNELHLIVGLVW